jgi:hypothetical protein
MAYNIDNFGIIGRASDAPIQVQYSIDGGKGAGA